MTRYQVCVDVATGWTSPDAPRAVDAPALSDPPDLAGWVAAMSGEERRDLNGRTLTQLLAGEPVEIVAESGDWVRVIALWQPAPEDARGYPAWVRRAHLRPAGDELPEEPHARIPADWIHVLGCAREFIGLGYLWGGTSPYGFDCSGLVHYAHRAAGIVVPRDAAAQSTASEPIPLGTERPGDLYFFAEPGRPVVHVGFVSGERNMLHAPGNGNGVEDAPLALERQNTLVGAGRFLT